MIFNAFPAIAYSADSLCLRYPFLLFDLYSYNFLLLLLYFLFLLIGKIVCAACVQGFFLSFLGFVRIGMNGNDDMVAVGGTCLCKRTWLRM
ncbi:hypothetical protein ACQKWADRAFT_278094 [Trichoderma austrokoningii]